MRPMHQNCVTGREACADYGFHQLLDDLPAVAFVPQQAQKNGPLRVDSLSVSSAGLDAGRIRNGPSIG